MPSSTLSTTKSITSGHSSTSATKIPITTTITSPSSTCVVALQGQVLNDGVTAAIYNDSGNLITLNSTCFHAATSLSNSRITHTGSSSRLAASSTASIAFPSATKSATQHGNGLSAGIIAGLVLAIIAILVASSAFAFWLWYRRRSRMAIIDMPTKTLDEDASNQIPFRWETDGAEIKEMSAVDCPVEIGDNRSIRPSNYSTVDVNEAVSPVSTKDSSAIAAELDGIVSPINQSPLNPSPLRRSSDGEAD